MNIVITGGRGFLGCHVASVLKDRRVKVTAIGRKDGDLRNRLVAHKLLKNADTIVHLAADVGGLGYLRERPAVAFHDNHKMGLNVISAACVGRAKRLILAGTPCSYATNSPLPLREKNLHLDVPSGETGSYGYAKLAISKTAAAICPLSGVEVVTVIPANLYGPFDNFVNGRAHVIAALLRKAFIAKAARKSFFEVWGDGSATRDFVYVTDVAHGIASVATAPIGTLAGQTFNLGSGQETSMLELAHLVAKTVGRVEPHFSARHPIGYSRRVMSIDEATRQLGFTPTIGLSEGLEKTVCWLQQSGMTAKWNPNLRANQLSGVSHSLQRAA